MNRIPVSNILMILSLLSLSQSAYAGEASDSLFVVASEAQEPAVAEENIQVAAFGGSNWRALPGEMEPSSENCLREKGLIICSGDIIYYGEHKVKIIGMNPRSHTLSLQYFGDGSRGSMQASALTEKSKEITFARGSVDGFAVGSRAYSDSNSNFVSGTVVGVNPVGLLKKPYF